MGLKLRELCSRKPEKTQEVDIMYVRCLQKKNFWDQPGGGGGGGAVLSSEVKDVLARTKEPRKVIYSSEEPLSVVLSFCRRIFTARPMDFRLFFSYIT